MTVEFDARSKYVQIINCKSHSTELTRHGLNPTTLEALSEVPVATPGDHLDKAVAAGKNCRQALVCARAWSYEDRKKAILAYADAIEK
ncbi:hypothetical protein N7493_003303 [Penicillium malachiteum]|uniref:Uncharacterized protein n=1 Tax=Penicillium malachiteum TaxID=1324776 RepID=A0AAD6HPF1_9EURO|nr:hypothetical protein N7493_003303 [Penicillium malachiteum]